MTPLRPQPYREVCRRLLASGFVIASQRGSHVKFVRLTEAGTFTAIVPQHREISPGTLRSILRQANLTVEEFEKL